MDNIEVATSNDVPGVVERWHAYIDGNDPALLAAMVADDAVFRSPAVYRPQHGKPLVLKYLNAAMRVLNNDSFRYVEQWVSPRSAVLHFALEIDGIEIEGIDMMHWKAAGLITEFTVMIRPLKAINTVIPLMAALLQEDAA